jgi:anaerobic selenocysteine-containing dehydrogenase
LPYLRAGLRARRHAGKRAHHAHNVEASWEEAIEDIAARLKAIVAEYGSNAVGDMLNYPARGQGNPG